MLLTNCVITLLTLLAFHPLKKYLLAQITPGRLEGFGEAVVDGMRHWPVEWQVEVAGSARGSWNLQGCVRHTTHTN